MRCVSPPPSAPPAPRLRLRPSLALPPHLSTPPPACGRLRLCATFPPCVSTSARPARLCSLCAHPPAFSSESAFTRIGPPTAAFASLCTPSSGSPLVPMSPFAGLLVAGALDRRRIALASRHARLANAEGEAVGRTTSRVVFLGAGGRGGRGERLTARALCSALGGGGRAMLQPRSAAGRSTAFSESQALCVHSSSHSCSDRVAASPQECGVQPCFA